MFAFGEHVETVTAGPGVPQVGRRLVTAILGSRAGDAGEPSQQVFRVRPHRHPVDLEPPADGDHAFAVRSGSSDSVHLAVRQRCSSSSPRVRHGPGLGLGGFLRLIVDTEFRLLPRGTEPLEPLAGVRFESTRVHTERIPYLRVPPLRIVGPHRGTYSWAASRTQGRLKAVSYRQSKCPPSRRSSITTS